MAGTTPVYGFPYQSTDDAPDGPALGEDLALAVETEMQRIDGGSMWSSYTPTWTGATSNPSIGNGTIVGRYLRMGNLVISSGLLTMGSTTTYGSGEWRVGLPTAAVSLAYGGGGGIVDASSSANDEAAGVNLYSATQIRFFTSSGPAANGVPFAWQSGDTVNWSVIYEAS